jgi:hypothetical protein
MPASPQTAPALPRPSHRFDFSGSGTTTFDALTRVPAQLVGGAKLDGVGAVDLHGDQGAAVELPDGLLADVEEFTLLAWVQLRSDDCWQRIVDFLYVSMPPPNAPSGAGQPSRTLLYLTPYGCVGPAMSPTVGYRQGDESVHLSGHSTVALQKTVQLGFSYNSRTQTLRLIQDGTIAIELVTPVNLHAIHHARGLVGRSSFDDDPAFDGKVFELRVYPVALDAEDLRAVFQQGPE